MPSSPWPWRTAALRVDADVVLYALLLALAASLPFEPIRPLVALGFLDLNHLKLLLAASGAVWLVGLRHQFTQQGLPRDVWAIGLFLTLAVLSSVLAPS